MQEPGVDVMDENPVKVDSQVLSVHVEPELPQPIKVPVSFTFANDDVSLFFDVFQKLISFASFCKN